MKKNHLIIYSSLLAALLLSACKVGKNYERPAVVIPKQFNDVAYADTSSIADLQWKTFFADTTLQGLITRGIKYNYDLQIAVKRIDIANQQVKQAKLLNVPQINLQVTGQYNRPSDNSLNGLSTSAFLGTRHIEDYNANLNLSWEADIWGKIRRQKEGVLAQYLQTFEATRAVQTQLVADIAQGYYNLLMLDKQLTIAKQNLRLTDSTLQLTKLLKNAGEVNLLAVQQADAQKQSTALLIPQLEQSVAIQENALQLLTGQLPGTIARNANADQLNIPVNLPAGLPAAVVSRRPDIRSNEMALKAANAQVGVSQGNMYPSLTINASGGLNSFQANNWFSIPGAVFGLVNGSLIQPLINNRKLKTQFEIAKVQREQSVLVFRQSVLTAITEVSNAMVQNDKLKQQRLIATGQVDILRGATKNAQLLFKSDMANYLEVITAQSNALQAELNLASVERQQMGAVVELYRSLGGGWK